jgi:hypothetical protein
MKFNEAIRVIFEEYLSKDVYYDVLFGSDKREFTINDLKDIDLTEIVDSMVVPERSKDRERVLVNVDRFDDIWQKSDMYIGPNGVGGIKKRYPFFIAYLLLNPEERNIIETPEVSITKSNEIEFLNGRHRFAVLRDAGVKQIPIALPKNRLEQARNLGII